MALFAISVRNGQKLASLWLNLARSGQKITNFSHFTESPDRIGTYSQCQSSRLLGDDSDHRARAQVPILSPEWRKMPKIGIFGTFPEVDRSKGPGWGFGPQVLEDTLEADHVYGQLAICLGNHLKTRKSPLLTPFLTHFWTHFWSVFSLF